MFDRIDEVGHRSYATSSRQSRQVRKEATVTGSSVCSGSPVSGFILPGSITSPDSPFRALPAIRSGKTPLQYGYFMARTATSSKLGHSAVPPAIEQYFQICLLLLLSTGFVTLASTGKLDALSVVIVSCALFFRGYLLGQDRVMQIPEKITSYLGLVYILVYVFDYFFVSQSFVQATVHLLLFGMIVKLFSVQRARDFVYLAMLAFLEVLSAAILTVDSVFFAALSVFLLIAVLTFIALEMRRSALEAGTLQNIEIQRINSKKKRPQIFSYSVSTTGLVLVGAILLASVAIFFALPRLSGGYMSKLAQQ